MHTGHNDKRHSGGQDAYGEPRNRVVHDHKDVGQYVAGYVADGAEDTQGAGNADDEKQQRF